MHEWKYAVTEKSTSEVGTLEALQPKSPDDRLGWSLVSVNVVGAMVICHWKRPR
jgi:hypothetical protein